MVGPGKRGIKRQQDMVSKTANLTQGSVVSTTQNGADSLLGSKESPVNTARTSSIVRQDSTTNVSPQASPDQVSRQVEDGTLSQRSESHARRVTETNLSPESSLNDQVPPERRTRGPTRNISLSKKRDAKQKLNIEVPQDVGRIVGKDSQYFITEAGCVVRKWARLHVPKWSRLDDTHREDLCKMAKDGFDVDELPHTKSAISKQLNSQYRNRKHRLYRYFKQYKTKEEAKQHVPENVQPEDWIWLCDHFASEEFLAISQRNKKNRAKHETPTTVGTKSLARVVEEKKRKEGKDVSEIDLYEMSRFSKKKGHLINEKAEEVVAEMRELQATTSLTSEQICVQVIGYIPGQVRGRGVSKSHKLAFEQYHAAVEDSRKRAEDAEHRAAEMFEQLKQLQEQQRQTNDLVRELTGKLNQMTNTQ